MFGPRAPNYPHYAPDTDICSPKRRQTAQATTDTSFFKQNSGEKTNPIRPLAAQIKDDREAEIIIEGTASEQSAFAFLASQDSNHLFIQEAPGSANPASSRSPIRRKSNLARFPRGSRASPVSQTAGLTKTFEDSPHNSLEETPSVHNVEGENDEFCGIKFDSGAPLFKLKRAKSLSEIDTSKFRSLLVQCKQAFLLSEASDQVEATLVHFALVGSSLACPYSGRMILGNFLILISVGVQRALSDSGSPLNQFATAISSIGLAKVEQAIAVQTIGLALLPGLSPAFSAAYAAYLSVQQMITSAADTTTTTTLVLIILARLLSDSIFPSHLSEHQWMQAVLAVPLILAIWIVAAKYSSKCSIQVSDLCEENKEMEKDLEQLEENQKYFFTDNREAMIVCQINMRQHSLGLASEPKITRVIEVNKGFQTLFKHSSLPSAFSKRCIEAVGSNEVDRMLSLQTAILGAISKDDKLFKMCLPESDRVSYIYFDIAPIRFNLEEAYLVKIQQVGPAINQQNKKMQAIFQEALISTIQHEQLNPLNSIINLSSLLCDQFSERVNELKKKEQASPEFGSSVELEEAEQTLQWTKIIRSSSIMMQLLNAAILNQGQIDSQKFKPTYDVVKDPLDIVAKLTDLFDEHAKSQQLAVLVEGKISGTNAAKVLLRQRGMMMEVALYEQILFNILVNAFKFNKQQGSVQVKLDLALSGDEGQSLELRTTILDSGMGMTEDKKRKLGKMFESICIRESAMQPRPERARQATSGVGLGFSLSQKLVSFLGGSISVQSSLNQGTEVTVSLVCKLGPRSRTPPSASKVSQCSFHSIDLLQGSGGFVPASAERKAESPEVQLSSIAFQFKQRRNQMQSASNLKYSSSSNLSISRTGEEAKSQGKSKFSRFNQFTSDLLSEESKQSPSVSEDTSEVVGSNKTFEMKREFSFSNQNVLKQGFWQRNSSSKSKIPCRKSSTFLRRAQSKSPQSVSDSSSSDEESNFGNLTDNHSPEIMIMDTLQVQSSLSNIKTKSSLNSLAKMIPDEAWNSERAISTPSQRNEATEPEQPVTQCPDRIAESMETLSQVHSRQLTISAETESDEELNADQLNQLAREQQLKRRPLPQLQQIQEDFEEDKGSVLGKSIRKQKHLDDIEDSSEDSEGDQSKRITSSLEADFTEAEEVATAKLLTPQNSRKRASRFSDKQLKLSLRKEPPKNCNSPVLLVDDSHFNIATLEVMISVKFSTKCLIARNGRQAVDLFKQLYVPPGAGGCPHCTRPCCDFRGVRLVFMDLNMPVMDGFEAAEKILAFQGEDQRCSVVALTAFQDPKTREKCLAVGMKEVLAKPASQELIGRTIKKYCGLEERKKSIK